jgi:hypothetical protein
MYGLMWYLLARLVLLAVVLAAGLMMAIDGGAIIRSIGEGDGTIWWQIIRFAVAAGLAVLHLVFLYAVEEQICPAPDGELDLGIAALWGVWIGGLFLITLIDTDPNTFVLGVLTSAALIPLREFGRWCERGLWRWTGNKGFLR